MSWVDSILTSSVLIWAVILLGILHFYLRKTGKTLLEFIKEIKDFFNGLMEDGSDVGRV